MLEDEQKKIITYHRIWFVRLIAMIVACQALKQLIGASPLWREEYPFGLAFYTKYARLCNLDDFVKVYGANFWLGLKVLFTCALVCYVLAWIMQKVNEKTSARLDLFADVTVIAVLIVDFISNLYCFKAHVYAEQSTVLYFVRIAVMIIVLLIHIYEYRRNKNLFDKETKLMRGKNKDGNFMAPFSPLKWGDAFTEGNSWHYTWSVFHDPQGLIDLMGGRKEFITMLDSVFAVPPVFDDSYYGQVIHEIREMQIMNMGNYAHGNQPIQHMIYLYNYAGEPWKAQYWLRQVMDRMYTPTPDGYCGDEDNGQTSAWYVFSALGFYPVAPGTTQYVLGAPLFKKATLHFENGKSLVVNAPENSDKNIYIESMSFNGKNYTKNYLEHFELLKGGVLDIKMGDEPNMNRGVSPEDFPYSFSVNEKQKK